MMHGESPLSPKDEDLVTQWKNRYKQRVAGWLSVRFGCLLALYNAASSPCQVIVINITGEEYSALAESIGTSRTVMEESLRAYYNAAINVSFEMLDAWHKEKVGKSS